MKNNPFQEALIASTEYLEETILQKCFLGKPPKWALASVWEVFEISLQERTKAPEFVRKALSENSYVRALQYLYPCVPKKETPLRFLAVIRFLNLLASECRSMEDEEKELGQEVLEVLRILQNPGPEEVIASTVYAHLGIHLNS